MTRKVVIISGGIVKSITLAGEINNVKELTEKISAIEPTFRDHFMSHEMQLNHQRVNVSTSEMVPNGDLNITLTPVKTKAG